MDQLEQNLQLFSILITARSFINDAFCLLQKLFISSWVKWQMELESYNKVWQNFHNILSCPMGNSTIGNGEFFEALQLSTYNLSQWLCFKVILSTFCMRLKNNRIEIFYVSINSSRLNRFFCGFRSCFSFDIVWFHWTCSKSNLSW